MLKDNIKVGDYARNKKGIGKITDIKDHGEYVEIILDNFHDIIEYSNGKEAGTLKNKIIMRKGIMRENIKIGKLIDLIEEKDIITYEYETSIGTIIEYNVTVLLSLLNELEENPNKYKIKSIITHEQIETMEYKIEK